VTLSSSSLCPRLGDRKDEPSRDKYHLSGGILAFTIFFRSLSSHSLSFLTSSLQSAHSMTQSTVKNASRSDATEHDPTKSASWSIVDPRNTFPPDDPLHWYRDPNAQTHQVAKEISNLSDQILRMEPSHFPSDESKIDGLIEIAHRKVVRNRLITICKSLDNQTNLFREYLSYYDEQDTLASEDQPVPDVSRLREKREREADEEDRRKEEGELEEDEIVDDEGYVVV